MSKHRIRLNEKEALQLGFTNWKKDSDGKNTRFYLDDKQYIATIKARTKAKLKQVPNKRKMVETIIKYDKKDKVISRTEKLQSKPIKVPEDFEIIKISTSATTGQQWIQSAPKKISPESFDFEAVMEKYIGTVKPLKPKVTPKIVDFEVLTYTDVHIGMETDKFKTAMYAEKWDRVAALAHCDKMIVKTLEYQHSDHLVVDELGDMLDGFDGYTTRGGHKLPQNMTNQEAYDCAIEFKLRLLNGLSSSYETIKFNNICNDNHAGDFGYFANRTFQLIAKDADIVNHRQFINHYYVGDVCFVITHGKDSKSLKFGFKPKLDDKQIKKIDAYLKFHKIYSRAKRIIFKKGDTHQALFDYSSSSDFDYFNYPALSPSSEWVQTNFEKGRRGFVLEHFRGLESTLLPIFI